jgi:hypothetical protein
MEEHGMMLLGNTAMRKIFGLKRNGRRLNSGELYNLHASSNIYYSGGDRIRKNELDRVCRTYRGEKSCIHGIGGEI